MNPYDLWRLYFQAWFNWLHICESCYMPDRTEPNHCGFVDAPTEEPKEMLGYGGY